MNRVTNKRFIPLCSRETWTLFGLTTAPLTFLATVDLLNILREVECRTPLYRTQMEEEMEEMEEEMEEMVEMDPRLCIPRPFSAS